MISYVIFFANLGKNCHYLVIIFLVIMQLFIMVPTLVMH